MAQELHLFQHSLDKESRRVRNICFENKFDRSGCVDTHSTEAPIVRGGTTYAEQGESLAEPWKGEWWLGWAENEHCPLILCATSVQS